MPITTTTKSVTTKSKSKSKYIEIKTCTVCGSKVLDVDSDGLCLLCVEKENIKIRIHRLEKEYTETRKEINEISIVLKDILGDLKEDDF